MRNQACKKNDWGWLWGVVQTRWLKTCSFEHLYCKSLRPGRDFAYPAFTILKNYVRMIKAVIITIVSVAYLIHHFFKRLQKHAGYKLLHSSGINQ